MKRDEFYEQQKNERKKQAMEENKQRQQKALEDEDETATGKRGGDGDAGGDSGVDKLLQDVESQAGHLDLKGEFEKFKGK